MSFTKVDSGSWTLTNTANSFYGFLKVANGTLAVATLNGNGLGAITLGSTTSNESATLRFIGSGTDANPITNAAHPDLLGGQRHDRRLGTPGSLLDLLGNASVSTTGALGQGVYNYNLTLTGSGAGEIDGLIRTGSGSVTKNGSGLWVLGNQNNSYTGGTRVNGGTLQTIQQDALGPGGLTINGGTVDLAGQSQTVATLSGSAGGILTSSVSGGNLTVSGSVSGTFAGTIVERYGFHGR